MREALLGLAAALAAIAVPAAPAAAQDWAASAFSPGSGLSAGSSQLRGHPGGRDWRGDRDNRRDRRRNSQGVFIADWDREWQGDTAWRSDSYNDWWHERPARSYPRWMQNNQNCERLWWGGEGWRC